MVRVRFAPSPTGEPHLGNIRTAIMNYIFAANGTFLLRIEDTDVTRSKIEYTESIIDKLNWLHMPPAEPPIVQSTRFDIYREKAKYLYDNHFAYYCKCVAVDVTEMVSALPVCTCIQDNYTTGILRFKVPKNIILQYDDLVYGSISVNTNEIENFGLVRTDGTPTYMLCVVIDDILSNITHIIRGEDHRTNTFKQILLYNAFKASLPVFAHLPMIKGEDGKKLSKRNGGASIEHFRSIGIDYRGLINYVMRLGWGHGNQEYFTIDELITLFDIKNVKKSSGKFDVNKMYKCSAHFIQQYAHDLTEFNAYTQKYTRPIENLNIDLYANTAKKCSTYGEIYNYLKFLHEDVKSEVPIEDIHQIKAYIDHIDIFNMETCQAAIKYFVQNNLHKSFRLLMTSSNVGCDLTLGLYALGLKGIKHKIDIHLI